MESKIMERHSTTETLIASGNPQEHASGSGGIFDFAALEFIEGEYPEELYQNIISYIQNLNPGSGPVETLGNITMSIAIQKSLKMLHPLLPGVVQESFVQDLKNRSLPSISNKISTTLPSLLKLAKATKKHPHPIYIPASDGKHNIILMLDPRAETNLISRATAEVLVLSLKHSPQQEMVLECHYEATHLSIRASIIENPLYQLVVGAPFMITNGLTCHTTTREVYFRIGHKYTEPTTSTSIQGNHAYPEQTLLVQSGACPLDFWTNHAYQS